MKIQGKINIKNEVLEKVTDKEAFLEMEKQKLLDGIADVIYKDNIYKAEIIKNKKNMAVTVTVNVLDDEVINEFISLIVQLEVLGHKDIANKIHNILSRM